MSHTPPPAHPLRIAVLSEFVHPFHLGGAERRYYELTRRLAARGHEFHWFAMQHWPGSPDMLSEGVHLHRALGPIDVYSESGGRAIGPGLQVGLALSNALRKSPVGFDVIDCSLYPFFHIFGARAVRPRTPVVVTWYEFWGRHWYEYLGKKGFVGKQVERAAAIVPTRILSVSEATTDALVAAGVRRSRISTVPLGVDLQWIDSVESSPDRTDLVFFGRLKNHKNVALLIRAVGLVRKQLPGITCAIVGDGPERSALERLAEELDLSDAVRFLGALPDADVIAHAKASRVFVHPSTKEGGGSITLLEANACSLPVIAVNHPLGIDRRLIEDGRNGWWAPEATAETLAERIVYALGDESRLTAVSRSSREFARRFDWDRIADQCEAIYRDLAAR